MEELTFFVIIIGLLFDFFPWNFWLEYGKLRLNILLCSKLLIKVWTQPLCDILPWIWSTCHKRVRQFVQFRQNFRQFRSFSFYHKTWSSEIVKNFFFDMCFKVLSINHAWVTSSSSENNCFKEWESKLYAFERHLSLSISFSKFFFQI